MSNYYVASPLVDIAAWVFVLALPVLAIAHAVYAMGDPRNRRDATRPRRRDCITVTVSLSRRLLLVLS